jgi:hypothetical protein
VGPRDWNCPNDSDEKAKWLQEAMKFRNADARPDWAFWFAARSDDDWKKSLPKLVGVLKKDGIPPRQTPPLPDKDIPKLPDAPEPLEHFSSYVRPCHFA